jgi:hypothetical protein
MTDLERLAEEWLEERRMGSASGVWHRVQILAELQPEQAWALTKILLRATKPQLQSSPRDNALRIHVASILNRILERYLAEFIDRVESEAASEPLFKELLAPYPVTLRRLPRWSG